MDRDSALPALAAQSRSTRLAACRLLMHHEPGLLAAGEVARRLDVPQNTVSTHLSGLQRAGLIRAERSGRSIVYRADLDELRMLSLFKDCCGGRANCEGR